MNLEDRNIRRTLADKYLSAETTIREERELAEYYQSHSPEDDEKALAGLLLAIEGERLLSDDGEAEFDRIVNENKQSLNRRRVLRLAAGIAAAAVVALGIILPSKKEEETPLSPVVIAEGIGPLMDINSGEVESISAVPQGSKALVTLKLRDGSEYYYMMTYNEDAGTTSLVAINDK